MANTYAQIYIHIVFAVKFRDAMLHDDWRDDLIKYIAGIIRNNGQKLIKGGGWRDHVHLLISCNTSVNIANLVKDIKIHTNKWIQPKHKCRISWQAGYAAISISHSHVDPLCQYIENQPQHHAKVTMVDEFKRLLAVNRLEYDDRFLPKNPE